MTPRKRSLGAASQLSWHECKHCQVGELEGLKVARYPTRAVGVRVKPHKIYSERETCPVTGRVVCRGSGPLG